MSLWSAWKGVSSHWGALWRQHLNVRLLKNYILCGYQMKYTFYQLTCFYSRAQTSKQYCHIKLFNNLINAYYISYFHYLVWCQVSTAMQLLAMSSHSNKFSKFKQMDWLELFYVDLASWFSVWFPSGALVSSTIQRHID